MSSGDSEPAPSYYFSGIIFNPDFYVSASSTYLTQATAKLYFLSYPFSQGSEIFTKNITLQSTLTDALSSVGTSGQVLSSTGTGTNWVDNNTLNSYLALNIASLPYTLPIPTKPSTYIYASGGTVSGGTLTIPTTGVPNSTYIFIKNNGFGFNLNTSLMTFSQSAIISTIYIENGVTISLFYNGSFWIQTAVSDKMSSLNLTSTLYSSFVSSDNFSQSSTHTEINMFSDTTIGDIFLGKTLPAPQTVRIANTSSGASGASVHCSNIGFDGSNINNATTPALGTIKLGNSLTSGSLYIGCGSTTATHTSGPIFIGSDSTATGGINIATGTDLSPITANTINIGQTSYTTNINGVLVGKDGCLAGRTNYVSYNTSALPATLSTSINMNLFVYLFGSTALKVLTIPVVSVTGQIITIKNGSSVDVSLSFTNVMLFDSTSLVSAVMLQTKGVISIYWGGAFWIQTVPSNAMSELTATGDIKTTTGKLIGATLDAVADTTAGNTALTIGSNVVLGNIVIGNSQTTGDIIIGASDIVGATITVGTASTATTINGTLTQHQIMA